MMLRRFRSRSFSTAFAIAVCISAIGAETGTSKPLLENEHVRVTRFDLTHNGTLPANNNFDVLTVQLENGNTAFIDPGQLAKTTESPAGEVHYFVARSKRSIKNKSKQPIPFIQIEFLRTPGKYTLLEVPGARYCNPGPLKACVTEQYLFCTSRFCVESVTLDPGAISTQHTHDADHMVIPVSDFTWREEVPDQAATDHEFKTGTVSYVPAGVTHRLINVGTTTAKMVVLQYK
jgi:quercetin dioxygenase-like cupin family protein